MRSTFFLLAAFSFAAAGCAGSAGNDQAEGNAAAPAAPQNAAAPAPPANAAAAADPVLRSETVTGTFTGWEMGDYLWAKIAVPGRETISAQPGPTPVDPRRRGIVRRLSAVTAIVCAIQFNTAPLSSPAARR